MTFREQKSQWASNQKKKVISYMENSFESTLKIQSQLLLRQMKIVEILIWFDMRAKFKCVRVSFHDIIMWVGRGNHVRNAICGTFLCQRITRKVHHTTMERQGSKSSRTPWNPTISFQNAIFQLNLIIITNYIHKMLLRSQSCFFIFSIYMFFTLIKPYVTYNI